MRSKTAPAVEEDLSKIASEFLKQHHPDSIPVVVCPAVRRSAISGVRVSAITFLRKHREEVQQRYEVEEPEIPQERYLLKRIGRTTAYFYGFDKMNRAVFSYAEHLARVFDEATARDLVTTLTKNHQIKVDRTLAPKYLQSKGTQR